MSRRKRLNDVNGHPSAGKPTIDTPKRRVSSVRALPFTWLARHVIKRYFPTLGPLAIATYVILNYHADRETDEAWPSLNTMAREIGASRSTVERSLKLLKELGLIEVYTCIDPDGQHSNTYVLVDPGEPPPTYPPGAHGGGAIPPTAPPSPSEGAPLSIRQGGAVGGTAPPRTGSNEQDPVKGEGTPPPDLRSAQNQDGADPLTRVVGVWMACLYTPAPKLRAEHATDITAEAAELLRRGWKAEDLIATIEAAERDRAEWPRHWRERLPRRVPRPAPQPPNAAEEAQRAAQKAADAIAIEKARAELIAAGGIEGLRRKRRASAPRDADAPPR